MAIKRDLGKAKNKVKSSEAELTTSAKYQVPSIEYRLLSSQLN